MSKQPAPFHLTLTREEADMLSAPAGKGGFQGLHDRLLDQLKNGNLDIELNDQELGELVRYMTRYGQGGFQGRLYNAFHRSLTEMLTRN